MRVIDTHSHLYTEEFDADRAEVVERAKSAGVEAIVLPAIDWNTMNRLENMCRQYEGYCFPMIGLHPEEVKEDYETVLAQMKVRLDAQATPYYIGIGEIGLDFYWDATYREQQLRAFDEQLGWAVERNLPVVIHSRNAHREIVGTLYKYKGSGLKGIFHCFCGTLEEAEELLRFDDFYIGLGGVLTFKKSALPAVAKEIPLSRLVVETDSPYLAPVPHRGKRNESAFVCDTLSCLAHCKGLSEEDVAKVTTNNAEKLFPALKKP